MRRSDRTVAYQLMHGALAVNAMRLHCLLPLPKAAGVCPCPECQLAGRPETLTHAFLDCPAAAPVLDWLLALWAALTPGMPQPPRDALLLLGDRRQDEGGPWQPLPTHAGMWNRLRVAWLGTVWEARCEQLGRPGEPPLPAQARAHATAAALLARINGAARLHWRRVESDVRLLAPAYPSSWFRGRDPALTQEAFQEDWGMGDRFCTSGAQPRLWVDWGVSATVPVPLPPAPAQPVGRRRRR
jgi:hypothetical protein